MLLPAISLLLIGIWLSSLTVAARGAPVLLPLRRSRIRRQ